MLGLLAQIKTFFLTLLLGLTAGIIFHYYQLTIRALRAGKYSLYLLDFFIWILMILLIAVGMLLINQGELRIYFFLILIAGNVIYFKLMSRIMEKPLGLLASTSAKGLRVIVTSAKKPAKWLQQVIKARVHTPPPPDDISE